MGFLPGPANLPLARVGYLWVLELPPTAQKMCISRINYGTARALFCLSTVCGSVINPGTGYKRTRQVVVESETKDLRC